MALGITLRLSMLSFDVRGGYDFDWHLDYINWFVAHPWQLPPRTLSPEVYHPPLYHWLAAWTLKAGFPLKRLNVLSVVFGIATLGLFQLGLRRFIPARPVRLLALALACVLPAGIHLDGMATNEALNNLLTLTVLLLAAHAFSETGRRRLIFSSLMGLVLGLALLTKFSSLVLFAAILIGVIFDRIRARSWALALLIATIVSSWYFASNISRYHKPILDAAECGQGWYSSDLHDFRSRPYLQRRPLSFFGWTNEILAAPYGPTAFGNDPRLLPALIASTFVDSYAYGFARPAGDGERFVRVARMKLRPTHNWLSQASVCGGSLIALTTLIAWLMAMLNALKTRNALMITLLAIPLLALAGQAHYAFLFPPRTGPVKGLYMQFVSPILCIVWGYAVVAMSRQRRLGRVAVGLELTALLLVTAYSIYCRFT